MAVSYPLYGSPVHGSRWFPFISDTELFIVAVAAMVVSAGLLVALVLVALAEAWWYRRHGRVVPGLTALRGKLWQRFALYWVALSFLEAIALFTVAQLLVMF